MLILLVSSSFVVSSPKVQYIYPYVKKYEISWYFLMLIVRAGKRSYSRKACKIFQYIWKGGGVYFAKTSTNQEPKKGQTVIYFYNRKSLIYPQLCRVEHWFITTNVFCHQDFSYKNTIYFEALKQKASIPILVI